MAEKGEVQRGKIEKTPAGRSLLVERVIKPVVKRLGWGAAAGPLLTVLAACSLGGDEVSPAQVAQPPTTSSTAGQQIEVHPTIDATVAPAASPNVEPAKPSPPPMEKPAIAPEKPPSPKKGSRVVEVDPVVTSPSRFRTVEQDLKIINQALDKFPQIGNLRVILTPGSASTTFLSLNPQESARIYLGRDVYLFEPKILDELVSYFDIRINFVVLSPYFSREELSQLTRLREAIVAKYRNFPQVEKMFASATNLAVTAYPDALFINQVALSLLPSGETGEYLLPQPLFDSFLAKGLLLQYAQEVDGKINDYVVISQFLEEEKIRVEQLKASSPFHKLAFELIFEKKQYLDNWQWTALQPVSLSDKYLDKYFREIVPRFENLVLTQALAEKDPRLMSLLTVQQQRELGQQYRLLFDKVGDELFARVYSRWLLGELGIDEMVYAYHQLIWQAKNP